MMNNVLVAGNTSSASSYNDGYSNHDQSYFFDDDQSMAMTSLPPTTAMSDNNRDGVYRTNIMIQPTSHVYSHNHTVTYDDDEMRQQIDRGTTASSIEMLLPSRRRPHPDNNSNYNNDCPIQAMKRLRVVDNASVNRARNFNNYTIQQSSTIVASTTSGNGISRGDNDNNDCNSSDQIQQKQQRVFQETGQNTMSDQSSSTFYYSNAEGWDNIQSPSRLHQQPQHQNDRLLRTPAPYVRRNTSLSYSNNSSNRNGSSSKKCMLDSDDDNDDGADGGSAEMLDYNDVNHILGNLHFERQQRYQNSHRASSNQSQMHQQQEFGFDPGNRPQNNGSFSPAPPSTLFSLSASATTTALRPSSSSSSSSPSSLPVTPINSNTTASLNTIRMQQNTQMYSTDGRVYLSNMNHFPKSPPPKPIKQKKVVVLQTDSKLG